PASSERSATRAERFADLTELNVATASTSVPPAVASEEIVVQSAAALDPGDDYCLRTLRPGLLLERDLGALGEGAEPVRVDARMMDEQVAAALVWRDDAEPLLAAEPLDRSGWHFAFRSPSLCYVESGRNQ